MISHTTLKELDELITITRKHDLAMRLHLNKVDRFIESLREDFDNINRMPPVKVGRPSEHKAKKKSQGTIQSDYVAIPTAAELEYYQTGLQLPEKPDNLKKLLDDMNRTGKFDYELCYLLRKQEAQDKLKVWVSDVMKKRLSGDQDYGKGVSAGSFTDLFENAKVRLKENSFRHQFMRSLDKYS